jgi:hypothetical protein
MDTLITDHTTSEHGAFVAATCGKTNGTVSTFVSPSDGDLWVTVCCKNASHQAWKGFGRMFDSFEDALAGYKSAEMKAIIEAARDLIAGEVSFDHTPANLIPFSTR